MRFADQAIIRHKILNAIRLLEVNCMQFMPDESIEFEYKGCSVNVNITVNEKDQNHKEMSEVPIAQTAGGVPI